MNDLEQVHAPAEWDSSSEPARVGTLEDFLRKERSTGIDVLDLEPGTVLTVRTRHSRYRLNVTDPRHRLASVTGGSAFTEDTPVRVEGSTLGGMMLRVGWIGPGFRLELSGSRGRTITSPVVAIDRDLPGMTTPR